VPILTYLLGMPEKTAVASSLAIVGGISLIGACRCCDVVWSMAAPCSPSARRACSARWPVPGWHNGCLKAASC
jgi:hypothetical protein